MEYRSRDRGSSHRRHHRPPSHHRQPWEGEDHADHHEFHNWGVKRVRFRSRSSPPPPLISLRHGMQSLSLHEGGGHVDQDDEYSTWDKPVVFAPEEASYRPQRWLEKLEKLEAQIVTGSAQPGPTLHEPIPDSHSLQVQREELHRLRPVLIGVRENLRTLQQAHYCSQSVNMLVLEKGRKEVVRLVDLTIPEIQKFIAEAIKFIDHDDIVSLSTTGSLLGYCGDILAWMEIRPRVLQQYRVDEMAGGSVRPSEHYERMGSRGTVASALIHALRATAYTLDIAVVSFVGAHLEPFDEVYFTHDHHHDRTKEYYYDIPCDEHRTSSIFILPRHFDCLSGFLGKNPAWVFEAHERGQVLDLGRLLYLRTSPEQLANVWGPVWRAETAERGGSSRFMLSKGFLTGWHHSSTVDPPLYAGEYLCHWTDDPALLYENAHSSAGLPRYINIKYLLIGARTHTNKHHQPHALELNRHCQTSSTEIYHQLQQHHELTSLGTHFAEWYLGPSNIPISVDPPGGFLGYGTDLVFKRRQGTSCREAVCSKLVAQPWKYLALLGDLYGVSISGCTGNARRVRLVDVILSPTMREFIACQLPWVLDREKWHHFRDLMLWHSSTESENNSGGPHAPDYVHITKYTTETQRYDYARYLKLAVGAIKDLPISSASDHIDALFAYHGTEYSVRISPGESECGWLGLLNDSLTSFSAPVVETSACLECRPGGIYCHHYHHHHFHHSSRYPPRTSSSTLDPSDDHYYLAPPPPRGSNSSIRSPSVVSNMSSSSRRSSISMGSGGRSRSRSQMSRLSAGTCSSHSHGHASHGYGTVLETTILVNPHALPAHLIAAHHSSSPTTHNPHDHEGYHHDKGKGKEESHYSNLHDWNYMEYMTDWKQPHHHHPMSEATEAMIKSYYPKGTTIDLGDAGELYVLGHLILTISHRIRDHHHNIAERAGSPRLRSRSGSSSRRSEGVKEREEEEEEELILIVERRRPKERMPRTVRYFLEKVHDQSLPREFHHGELVRLDDIAGHAGCITGGSGVYRHGAGGADDDDEVVIIEEHEDFDVDRDKERGRERGARRLAVEARGSHDRFDDKDYEEGNGKGTMATSTSAISVSGSNYVYRAYPGLRLRWPGRLLHVLVVSDVHDGLISEWVRDLEVEE